MDALIDKHGPNIFTGTFSFYAPPVYLRVLIYALCLLFGYDIVNNKTSSPSIALVSAARFATQARLVQAGPVFVAIIHCYFGSSFDTFTDQNHTLCVQPCEVRGLCICFAAVVSKAGIVALAALPDLILGQRR